MSRQDPGDSLRDIRALAELYETLMLAAQAEASTNPVDTRPIAYLT